MIGRGEELEFVLARVSGDQPGGVVVAGAAGVGKTRLATEALHAAAGLGLATARAVASRATSSIPFGALAPLLPSSDDAVDDRLDLLRKAAGWLSDLAGPVPGGTGGARRLVLVV